ncbi:MAG: enoyl-CoA hydratase/isomerase family protein [Candidatus Yanofskybacteria bacterium]|nr:enoyl-CoA hydratase/isomerase family protein [Candidatus Yanofskybacteria bacterium]
MAENQEPKVRLGRIKIDEDVYIAKITIQTPPKQMNQLSGEVLSLIAICLEKVREDARSIALIIEGRGLFSAGADVNEIWAIAQEGNKEKALELLAQANAVPDAIQNLGKPTIAVINGPCLGGGNELAMACTVRIASDENTTVIGQPEIKLGIIPGMGGTQRLPRLIPLETALRILISGAYVSATDALRYGLVDRVVPKEDLDNEARKFVEQLIINCIERKPRVFDVKLFDDLVDSDQFRVWAQNKSRESVDAILAAVKTGMTLSLVEALKLEQRLFAELVVRDSAKKGIAKFLGINVDSELKGGSFILPDSSNEVFSVYDLTEEQRMVRGTLKNFVAKEVLPQTARIESKEWSVTRDLLLKLGELGVLGIEVPEQYGGQNLDKTTAVILAEEVGRQASFACTVLADTGIGMLPIVLFGNEEQKKRFLPDVVSGKTVGAYSLTESGAGSDAKAIVTKATLREDGKAYILNGEKIFVTNGGLADYFILFAKVGDGKEITAFIVECGLPGVEVGSEEHKLGILGSSTTPVKLTDVLVPVENVLGKVGEGFSIAMNILNLGRFKLGAACLGGSRDIFQEALKYSRERKQFQVFIGNFGSIRKKLCRIAALIYGMEAIVYRTSGLLDKAVGSVGETVDSKAMMEAIREYAGECSIVKVWCSEASYQNAVANVEIHGGNGFMKDYPAERHLRDSVINMIFEGTNPINRLLLVKEFLKKLGMGLVTKGAKIQEELAFVLSSSSEDASGKDSQLDAQLGEAKKAFILAAGSVISKFGLTLVEHDNQEAVVLLADCLINLYVLDSALAVYAKHGKEKDQYLTRYLFHMLLPEIERDVMSLVVLGSEEDRRDAVFVSVRKLLKYRPENILELDRKIAENFPVAA